MHTGWILFRFFGSFILQTLFCLLFLKVGLKLECGIDHSIPSERAESCQPNLRRCRYVYVLKEAVWASQVSWRQWRQFLLYVPRINSDTARIWQLNDHRRLGNELQDRAQATAGRKRIEVEGWPKQGLIKGRSHDGLQRNLRLDMASVCKGNGGWACNGAVTRKVVRSSAAKAFVAQTHSRYKYCWKAWIFQSDKEE